MVFKPDFKQFFNFERMADALNKWAIEMPELCRLHVLGKSHRGREVYALEVAHFPSGDPALRPGYYIDACIHAEEVMGTNVAMYIAYRLLAEYGVNEQVTRLLQNQVFYILPRLNPDGAEFVLSTGHPWCGNGRVLPGEEQPGAGFNWHDLDNNGIVAQMRVPDVNGEWKISEVDSRFMELRKPYEFGGEYYRLIPEGLFRDYKGEMIFPKPNDGNLNRQFPASFYPEGRQYGAGDVPLQEPEAKAVSDFILAHPNIGGTMAYHTNAGAFLRPFSDRSDDNYLGNDLQMYLDLGAMGTELTGYPVISTYHSFTRNKDSVRGGTLKDWAYVFMGIPSFVTELWNVKQAANIQQKGHYPSDTQAVADDIKIINYLSQYMETPFVDWTPYEHPQLGQVEIGGWNRIWMIRNAPAPLLEDIAKQHSEFCFRIAAALPHLSIGNVTVTELQDGLKRIQAEVVNAGYLPTYLSEQARYMKAAKPVIVSLNSTDDFIIIAGEQQVNIGDLEGRSQRKAPWSQWGDPWQPSVKVVSWLVRCSEGIEFIVKAEQEKSGVASRAIVV